jgi:melanoma-associated antigen p97
MQAASYYSVAIVPREFCTAGVTLASLAGKRSCHTGFRKTAGWTMPMGLLASTGAVSWVCDHAGICVPP